MGNNLETIVSSPSSASSVPLRIGSRVRAPCGHEGRVVWVGDGVVAIRCESAHYRPVYTEAGRLKKETPYHPIFLLEEVRQ